MLRSGEVMVARAMVESKGGSAVVAERCFPAGNGDYVLCSGSWEPTP